MGPAIARLNRLAESGRPMAVSAEAASPTTLSALGGPPAGVPSSKDEQDSLEASWAAPSKVGRALEARFGES